MDVRSDVQRFGIGVLVLVLVVFAMVSLLRSPDIAIAPASMQRPGIATNTKAQIVEDQSAPPNPADLLKER